MLLENVEKFPHYHVVCQGPPLFVAFANSMKSNYVFNYTTIINYAIHPNIVFTLTQLLSIPNYAKLSQFHL